MQHKSLWDPLVKHCFCYENQHASDQKECVSSTRCFDSPLEGSHSTTLNAMTHDSAPDALDRCTLGDLCLRHLPGPQEQISTVFSLRTEGKQEAAIFFILGPRTNGTCKNANTPDREYFSPTKCLRSEKFNRLLYWFVIPLQRRLNILAQRVLCVSVSGHSFGNAGVCLARLIAHWDNIRTGHLPSCAPVLTWSYF